MDDVAKDFFPKLDPELSRLTPRRLRGNDDFAVQALVRRIIAQVECQHVGGTLLAEVTLVQLSDRGVIHHRDAQPEDGV